MCVCVCVCVCVLDDNVVAHTSVTNSITRNEKFFELKSRGYRDGIKRKETR